jgi:hypothetical protein
VSTNNPAKKNFKTGAHFPAKKNETEFRFCPVFVFVEMLSQTGLPDFS